MQNSRYGFSGVTAAGTSGKPLEQEQSGKARCVVLRMQEPDSSHLFMAWE